jgi:hypothetical protein
MIDRLLTDNQALGQRCPDELVAERHPTLNDPGGQARGVGTGGDNFGHVERRQVCEQFEHASFVPPPDSSRLRERELAQEAPVNRRAARRPGGTARVVGAGELDRESVQPRRRRRGARIEAPARSSRLASQAHSRGLGPSVMMH